jgi:hypothetical protein
MVNMVDLENPKVVYQGQIFWDMLRPGVRLAVMGPKGCMTSIIQRVVETRSQNQWYVVTKNSRYVLSTSRIDLEALQAMPTVVNA